MKKEATQVIALIDKVAWDKLESLPRSKTHVLTTHKVNLNNHFIDELGAASRIIEASLSAQNKVTLVARADTGRLAVAALMQKHAITELVTFWSVFDNNTTQFEREAAEWLRENQEKLTQPLRRKITTVYTTGPDLRDEYRLPGARRAVVKNRAPTWREGLKRLMWKPVEVYFNPDLQK